MGWLDRGQQDKIGRRLDVRPSWRIGVKRMLAWLRRRWALLLILVGVMVLVVLQFDNLVKLETILVQGQWPWLLATALLQGVYYLLYAVQYELGFATVEVESKWTELVPVMFASIFVATLVPSGGLSSLAIFVDDAARRGQSPARAAEGALLVLVADLATMVPLISYGLAYLAARGVILPYQIVASAFFLVFVAGLMGVILLGRWLPAELRNLLRWVQENVNWLASLVNWPPPLPPGWADRQANDYISAARHIGDHPHALGWTLTVAFTVHLVALASLYTVSLAYGLPLSFGAMTAAFSLNVVFSVVALIPQGLGLAEGIMALVLITLGVAAGKALAITLVFRGLNVWLPLVVGFLFLRRVRSFGGGTPR